MRFRVRRASISAERRDIFELYGPQVVALSLGLGNLPGGGLQLFPSMIMRTVLTYQNEASAWLREKRDQTERRETFGFWIMLVLTAIAAIAATIAALPIIKELWPTLPVSPH
jgi:hypothetical protein